MHVSAKLAKLNNFNYFLAFKDHNAEHGVLATLGSCYFCAADPLKV